MTTSSTDPTAPAVEKKPADNRLFVEPQTYRRRRLVDTIRMLPILGTLLWAVPLLWAADANPPRASNALIYIFLVWTGLVVVAALLIRRLDRGPTGEDKDHAV